MKLEDFTEFESSFASSCFQAMTSIQGKLERMRNIDGNIDEQNYVIELAVLLVKKQDQQKYTTEPTLLCKNNKTEYDGRI